MTAIVCTDASAQTHAPRAFQSQVQQDEFAKYLGKATWPRLVSVQTRQEGGVTLLEIANSSDETYIYARRGHSPHMMVLERATRDAKWQVTKWNWCGNGLTDVELKPGEIHVWPIVIKRDDSEGEVGFGLSIHPADRTWRPSDIIWSKPASVKLTQSSTDGVHLKRGLKYATYTLDLNKGKRTQLKTNK